MFAINAPANEVNHHPETNPLKKRSKSRPSKYDLLQNKRTQDSLSKFNERCRSVVSRREKIINREASLTIFELLGEENSRKNLKLLAKTTRKVRTLKIFKTGCSSQVQLEQKAYIFDNEDIRVSLEFNHLFRDQNRPESNLGTIGKLPVGPTREIREMVQSFGMSDSEEENEGTSTGKGDSLIQGREPQNKRATIPAILVESVGSSGSVETETTAE